MKNRQDIESFIRTFDLSLIPDEYLDKIAHLLQEDAMPIYPNVKISGSEVLFYEILHISKLNDRIKELKAEYTGEDGYYKMLKFLWVKYPNGEDRRLMEINENYRK